jgi:DMSO/TMAO reductase YedYZ molybdopterin-dependent catalytic subunit
MNTQHPHDPAHPHAHDPNFTPPSNDPAFDLALPDGTTQRCGLAVLRALPLTSVADCYIVSTGHGRSGPFTFAGARLLDLLHAVLPAGTGWNAVDVFSADGFGTRVTAAELRDPAVTRPILLAYAIGGRDLTRAKGLVRLIVPNETDDALRQVKWVGRVHVLA